MKLLLPLPALLLWSLLCGPGIFLSVPSALAEDTQPSAGDTAEATEDASAQPATSQASPETAAADSSDSSSEQAGMQQAAERLLACTLTVRITAPAPQAVDREENDRQPEGPQPLPERVTVCSGTSLGDGLIMTFDPASALSRAGVTAFRYRITLPGGRQFDAVPRVVDQYSALVLLHIENDQLASLPLAGDMPPVGARVLGAAAEGIEQPLVSSGIFSKIERRIRGTTLPPLLTSDVSTTEASPGAPIVDGQGRLLGIIAATSLPEEKSRWTFAVPVRHVRRLLKAQAPDRVIVLMRRRPIVGLVLGQGPSPGTVQVERVFENGPAAQSGIRRGDLVLEADGHKIRSAYQALALIRKYLPGESFEFLVEQDGERKKMKVVLGGGAAREVKLEQPGYEFGPQIGLRVAEGNRIQVRNGQAVRELSVDPDEQSGQQPEPSLGNEVDLLRRQVSAYGRVISVLQQQRQDYLQRDQQRQAQLESLRQELSKLKDQVEPAK